jgi:hypothetical protein
LFTETLPSVDVVALASVISSAMVGLTVPFYTAHRTARTAREGRVEQRSADGYLKILSLVEQEAQWLDSRVFNLGLDRKELEYDVVSFLEVPKPAVTDRATAAALVAALASEPVRAGHAAWRTAADDLDVKLDAIAFAWQENYPFSPSAHEDWMKDLRENFQGKERAARQVLAEAVAHELGHRRQRLPAPPTIWGPP